MFLAQGLPGCRDVVRSSHSQFSPLSFPPDICVGSHREFHGKVALPRETV